MDTKELEAIVRDRLLEYQTDPIDSTYILRCLNEAYRFAYNHFTKSNDTHFGEVYELSIVSGQSEYTLPENLWTKRVEHLQIPSPPNESQQPWGWVKIPKVCWKQSYRYQTNRIRTYYPNVWSQMNNKIYVYPASLVNFTAKLVISRRLAPLGTYCGRITNLTNNIITLDEILDTRLSTYVADPTMAYITVTDHTTGELKALYPYNAVNTTTKAITLTTAPYGRKYASYVIQDLTWVATATGITSQAISVQYINSGSSGLAVSASSKQITVNFGGATILASTLQAATVNAFKVIQDITWISVAAGTAGQSVSVEYTNVGLGGLAVSVASSKITVNFGGAASTATQVAVAALAVPAAVALVTPIVTGTGAAVQTKPVAEAYLVAPTSVTALASPVVTGTGSTVQVIASEVYLVGGTGHFMEWDISDAPGTQWGSIELDDIVCFGVATGVSIFGEAFDTFLTDWATQKVRGALNETDPEVVNSLKLQLQELSGDLGGRVTGVKINRSVMNQWGARPFRR